MRKVLKQLS